MPYPRAEVEAAIRGLAEAFKEAERTNKWSWIADKFYRQDCLYTCPYAGAMPVVARSRDEIRATHYGRDMDVGSGWAGLELSDPQLGDRGRPDHQPLGQPRAGAPSRWQPLRDPRRLLHYLRR